MIPQILQSSILDPLHYQRVRQWKYEATGRTTADWSSINAAIELDSRRWASCFEHQKRLVITEAFSRYQCISLTSSTSAKSTLDLLGGILTRLPRMMHQFPFLKNFRTSTKNVGSAYHPATNGAGQRLVHSFKHALRKFSLFLKRAFREFLMKYWRTTTAYGFSRSEIWRFQQIWIMIDYLMPLPAYITPCKQIRCHKWLKLLKTRTLHHLPCCNEIIVYSLLQRHVFPHSLIWRRHWDMLLRRTVNLEMRQTIFLSMNSSSDGEPGRSSTNSETSSPHDQTTMTRLWTG